MLTACGYQLRQSIDLPEQYKPVGIDLDRQYRDLRKAISDELEANFLEQANNNEDANLIIHFESVLQDNQLLTASAEGSPVERELVLIARVSWLDAEGKVVIPAEKFSLRRAYAYDDRAILSKEREADYLMTELEKDLAQRIVIRIRQYLKN